MVYRYLPLVRVSVSVSHSLVLVFRSLRLVPLCVVQLFFHDVFIHVFIDEVGRYVLVRLRVYKSSRRRG